MRQLGKRYFTGKPCKRGHIAERLSSTRSCIECNTERSRKPDIVLKVRENNRIWYGKNKTEVRKKRAPTNSIKCAIYRNSHIQEHRERALKWQRDNPARVNARMMQREAQKLQATPTWVDKEKVIELYEAAQAATEIFETPIQVDHIVPLRSKYVCGLHCEANLRLLPGLDNQRKSNRVWPDMPESLVA